MIRYVSIALMMVLATCPLAMAQANHDKTIRLTASVQEEPAQITLAWLAPSSGSYTITHQKLYRRLPGQDWGDEYATLATSDLSYTDTVVELGELYEYRIVRIFSNGPLNSTGYIEAGIHLREVDRRGAVLLLVKDTVATSMPTELTRLQEDLAGDGWHVIREDITASQTVADVKAVVTGHYNSPSTPDLRSVFLFGRIPVPYSGEIGPDGHGNRAWPADVFYAEMDGAWTDTEVDTTSAGGTRNDNVPGDGKYDQSLIPGELELEIGRVDLSDMTIFPDAATSENDLLRRYLNRDHDYRHLQGNYVSIPRRGFMDDNWGYRQHDTFASNAWWNFTAFFGAGAITAGDWFTTLNTDKYLWAYGGGPGSYTSASGVGTSAQFGTTDSNAVFCMMLGSFFGDWDNTNNFLRAPLAGTENGLALANMWTGRPHWHIHSMAMGETLGHGARRSQDNIGDYSTGFGAHQVHMALMGDPTLRLFPVIAPTGLAQVAAPGQVTLSWVASTDSDIQGHAIYRGATDARATGLSSRLNGALVTGSSYTDYSAVPGVGYTYMVRAVKLETSSSGTYRNSSQGIFIDATPGAVSGPEISISGNGESIQDGDASSLSSNHTAFGAEEINVNTISRVFTINNDGATDLILSGPPVVTISGTHATDFSVTVQPAVSTLASGSSTTFTVLFSPSAAGVRDAVISLTSDDADEAIFTFAINGVGSPNVPDINVATTSFSKTLAPGATDADTLNITNDGVGDLDFSVASEYAFRDSSHVSGPAYDWVDISTVGNQITSWSGSGSPTDNGGSASIPIGFDFPFYGVDQSTLKISTEGFLIFGNWVDAPSNTPSLPSLSAPANMIAAYWDDLDLRNSFAEADRGRVFYLQADPDTFIVQYDGVYQYSSSPLVSDERLTCQVILKSSGEITFQYKAVPTTTHYLVGLQNGGLDMGLVVAANSGAITNAMAVRVLPPAEDGWLAVSPSSGTAATTLTSAVSLDYNPSGMAFGDYFGKLRIRSNDPDTPSIYVDLELQGGDQHPEIELVGNSTLIPYQASESFESNHTDFGELSPSAPIQTRTYLIKNTGSATINLGTVSLTGTDFSLTQPVTTNLPAGASTTFDVSFPAGLSAGTYTSTVTIPNDDPNETSFTFVVKARILTPLEQWRLAHFGSSADVEPGNNDGDADGDGLQNLVEYALGSDPNVENASPLSISQDGSGRVEFHFQRDPAKTDIRYIVQASSSLQALSWSDIASSTGGLATVPSGAHSVVETGSPLVSVIVTDADTVSARRFLKLQIEEIAE